MQGNVFWITGLSGAGKTTIGLELTKTLRMRGHSVVFLDGDELRAIFGNNYGYTAQDRQEISLCYSRLCQNISKQGLNVVCSTVSLFAKTQQWNRENIENYIEIFVNVPMDELKNRDYKNVYTQSTTTQNTNVVGVNITPHFPVNPDLVINNFGSQSIQHSIQQILQLTARSANVNNA